MLEACFFVADGITLGGPMNLPMLQLGVICRKKNNPIICVQNLKKYYLFQVEDTIYQVGKVPISSPLSKHMNVCIPRVVSCRIHWSLPEPWIPFSLSLSHMLPLLLLQSALDE